MTGKRKSMAVGWSSSVKPDVIFAFHGHLCNSVCAVVNAKRFYQRKSVFARFAFAWRMILPFGRLAALTGLMLVLGVTPGLFGQNTEVLTNLAQVTAWPLAKATNGVPVRVRATITFIDPDWRIFFVQDDTGSLFVDRNAPSGDASWNLPPGQVVDLVGTTSDGIFQCNVKALEIRPVRPGPLPQPLVLDSEASYKNAGNARWVQVTGVITGVKTVATKLDLDLCVNPNRTIRLIVAQGNPVNASTLLGCMVEASGVFGFDLDANNKLTGRNEIWVSDLAGIQSQHMLPVTPISGLTVPTLPSLPARLVRVQGTIASQSLGEFIVVQDHSGSVRVNHRGLIPFQSGSPVEVYGYVARQGSALVLNGGTVLAASSQLAAESSPSGGSIPLAANNELPELRQVVQVRNLSASEAARGYPVRITGVLTYVNLSQNAQFIQDSSGGIFLGISRKGSELFPDALKLVEVTGFTGPGDFAPVVEVEEVHVLGDGVLPKPESVSMQVLMTGTMDSQWIALNGVVRSQAVAENATTIKLATGDSIVEVRVPNASGHPAPRNFVDAWVEVRGVCATDFDNQRHLRGIRILVPNWDEVRTWSVGADDPFALAVRPLSGLLEFHAGDEGLHRAHVRGTVLLCRADGSFYLQDATGGMLVQAQAAPGLVKVGQILDVVGFPSIVNKLPVFQEGIVRSSTALSALKPVSLAPESPLSQTLHGTLVRLQARVIDHSTDATGESLKLQFGPWITDAMLEKNHPDAELGGVESGSTVELTGVYLARLDDNLNVRSFQLMLRSPDDVRVLARPSWWTARRIIWLVAASGTAFALILAWVTLLHRQVNERTRELRAEIEERKRMEAQVAATHKELLVVSRGAGMAEVASNVLHNVGNVLNSVNVSATLVVDLTRKSKVVQLGKAVDLLDEHSADLGFLANPKGVQLRGYLHKLNEHLAQEQQSSITELDSLRKNIEHIKEIVTMQQSYAKISGVTETINVSELFEDALRMNEGSLQRHDIHLLREFLAVPSITVDKHKVLQILVNLIRNAKHACDDSARTDKQLRLRVSPMANGVEIAVIDNGIGIPPENLTRIFSHGFTTRKGGHGFGLHGGALAARELGGSLTAHSDGPGQGATFRLTLPLQPPKAHG